MSVVRSRRARIRAFVFAAALVGAMTGPAFAVGVASADPGGEDCLPWYEGCVPDPDDPPNPESHECSAWMPDMNDDGSTFYRRTHSWVIAGTTYAVDEISVTGNEPCL